MKTGFAGAALALAAAGLFGCAPSATTVAEESDVHCYGVNKCKGHNDCKTATTPARATGRARDRASAACPNMPVMRSAARSASRTQQ